jgi:hypothetical protein
VQGVDDPVQTRTRGEVREIDKDYRRTIMTP